MVFVGWMMVGAAILLIWCGALNLSVKCLLKKTVDPQRSQCECKNPVNALCK